MTLRASDSGIPCLSPRRSERSNLLGRARLDASIYPEMHHGRDRDPEYASHSFDVPHACHSAHRALSDLDDDDDDDYTIPSLSKPSFGSSSPTIGSDNGVYAHRNNPSADSFTGKYGGPSVTPTRPILPKASASYSVGVTTPNSHDVARLGKFSNGSSSSLVTANTSISSTAGFLGARKGSLASLKNAFTKGGNAAGGSSSVPPVPAVDAKHHGAPGYPALKNPFSRFDSPASPSSSNFNHSARPNGKASPGMSGFQGWAERKQSIATNHSSQRSHGGRSTTSQGSSSFRTEDHPVPALPPIPMRATPSRMGRMGSDAGSFFGVPPRRQGSLGGEDGLDGLNSKTPADEALRVVFREFKEAANQKLARLCARPLVSPPYPR